MKAVMNVHWDIAEHWHHCRLPVSAVFATDDAYAAFYTSKYLIQDTAEAIFAQQSQPESQLQRLRSPLRRREADRG